MSGATEANALFDELVVGTDFPVLDIDLSGPEYDIPGGMTSDIYDPVLRLKNSDLTTKTVDGSGTFDWIMSSISVHLKEEFTKGRIIGAEYTKAYIALMSAGLQTAVTFLVQRDASYWASVAGQIAAITGKVQLATAKMQFAAAQADAYLKQAQYAGAKMQLPLLEAQTNLVEEQENVQRAQTLETRKDGSSVAGVLKKQKDLITQQISSFLRDAEIKAAKMFADSWSVQKTIDEGLTAPSSFTNAVIDEVMLSVKTNNAL
jgi:hypothetical protein